MKKIILQFVFPFLVASLNAQHKFDGSIVQKKFDYMLTKDTNALNNILHDSLVYIHSSGAIDSKQSLIDNLFKSKNPYEKFALRITKIRKIKKDLVFVYANLDVSYAVDATKNSNLFITEVYVREKKNWKLLSRHANKLK